MKKLNTHTLALGAAALIVYLAITFLVPFAKTTVFWIAFLCTLGMFALAGAAFVRSFRRDESLESKVLGWPIFKVALLALAVQLVLDIALKIIGAACPVWAAVLVEILVFALFFILMVVRDASREAVTASEKELPDNTRAMKALRLEARQLAASLQDEAARRAMERLAEEMQFADPVSGPATEEMEKALSGLLSQIRLADTPEGALELVDQAQKMLQRRNLTAKLGK